MKKIWKIASKLEIKYAQMDLRVLSELLAYLRAASHIHQTHHWQTNGKEYYADHLLFMRLYDESQEFIDSVAERAVGLDSPERVDAVQQVDLVGEIVHKAYDKSSGQSADDMVKRSLLIEEKVLDVLEKTMDSLQRTNSLSHGTSNLLEGVADKHETFAYLLKQRGQVLGE